MVYIVLDQISYETLSAQLSVVESLCGETPLKITILQTEEIELPGCAVFPVFADANVYLEVMDCIQDAAKEVERVKAKVDEARRE